MLNIPLLMEPSPANLFSRIVRAKPLNNFCVLEKRTNPGRKTEGPKTGVTRGGSQGAPGVRHRVRASNTTHSCLRADTRPLLSR